MYDPMDEYYLEEDKMQVFSLWCKPYSTVFTGSWNVMVWFI